MNKRIIWALALDINEVVYLRRDGKIVAAKYLGLISKANGCGDTTIHRFYRADGQTDLLIITCGNLKHICKRVYKTIEDAIHDVNPIAYKRADITELTIDVFGFSHERSVIGGLYLGKTLWKWNGFTSESVHVGQFDFDIEWNGKWSCKYIGKGKYYNTQEECMQENHVDVVTF